MASTPAFEVLEHTADVGIRAFGAELGELLANAALGVESLAMETDRVSPVAAYAMSANGDDVQELLVNWLNEVIYYLDGRRLVMSRFEIESVSPTAVVARGWGEPRHPERHPVRLVVKAATFHQLKIEERDGGWIAEVFLDI